MKHRRFTVRFSTARDRPLAIGEPAQDGISMTEADQLLGRPQRRLLCRIYNGRTVPIVVDGMAFLTYREAAQYLLKLAPEDRDAAYAEMKKQAK